jgi:hypothetical protein
MPLSVSEESGDENGGDETGVEDTEKDCAEERGEEINGDCSGEVGVGDKDGEEKSSRGEKLGRDSIKEEKVLVMLLLLVSLLMGEASLALLVSAPRLGDRGEEMKMPEDLRPIVGRRGVCRFFISPLLLAAAQWSGVHPDGALSAQRC